MGGLPSQHMTPHQKVERDLITHFSCKDTRKYTKKNSKFRVDTDEELDDLYCFKITNNGKCGSGQHKHLLGSIYEPGTPLNTSCGNRCVTEEVYDYWSTYNNGLTAPVTGNKTYKYPKCSDDSRISTSVFNEKRNEYLGLTNSHKEKKIKKIKKNKNKKN